MTVAAPGEAPQTAVVPGSTSRRASTQPSAVLTPTTSTTTTANSSQSFCNSPRIEAGRPRAIRQPTTACAPRNGRLGTRTRVSDAASRMAAAIGPSSSAAGRCSASSTSKNTTDSTSSSTHWLAVVRATSQCRNRLSSERNMARKIRPSGCRGRWAGRATRRQRGPAGRQAGGRKQG